MIFITSKMGANEKWSVAEAVALHRCAAAPMRLIVVGVSPAVGGADTHFYGQFLAQTRQKLPAAGIFTHFVGLVDS